VLAKFNKLLKKKKMKKKSKKENSPAKTISRPKHKKEVSVCEKTFKEKKKKPPVWPQSSIQGKC